LLFELLHQKSGRLARGELVLCFGGKVVFQQSEPPADEFYVFRSTANYMEVCS